MKTDRKKLIQIVLLVSIPLIAVVCYAAYAKYADKSPQGSVPVTDWQTLRELDLGTGIPSEKLKNFDGIKIRMPGFMVPLEDNKQEVSEFLLVPTPQACIHVPPPPANQMVLIKMVDGHNAKMAFGPVWVEGIFRISAGNHMYGTSSFTMIGEKTEPYKVDY